ncbi:hypothetical protein HDV01_006244 [Terramyces sp. JEL0728]|nr:hypothetical protein HDV01_006244 [Terramyces sp. JEL0728]
MGSLVIAFLLQIVEAQPPASVPTATTVPYKITYGNCGNGVVCPGGYCCSQFGWCGSGEDSCGAGCQPLFGKCDSPQKSNPSSPTATTVPYKITYGNCGNGVVCPGGYCCSKYGWCGSGMDSCGTGCQPLWGICGSHVPTHTTKPPAKTTKVSTKTTTKKVSTKTTSKKVSTKTTSKPSTKTVTKKSTTKAATATHHTTTKHTTTKNSGPTGTPIPQGKMFSPYCDILMYPTIDIASIQQTIGLHHFTLAFIGSDAFGKPSWGGQALVDKSNLYFIDQINAVRAGGGDVTISFGGANIVELAVVTSDPVALAAKYQFVIDVYKAKSIDFDIEGDVVTNAAANDVRSQAIRILNQNNPGLTVSATLPCTPNGLIASGLQVLTSAAKYGAQYHVLNCMAFDFGSYFAPQGMTQMASYAISAATAINNQGKSSGLSNYKAGITIMIGNDDVQGEVFSLANGAQLLQFAQQNPWLGLVSFWSLNRDNGNFGPLWASSGISQTPYEFSIMFNALNTGAIQLFRNEFEPVTARDQERPAKTTGIAAQVTTILNNIRNHSRRPDHSNGDQTKTEYHHDKTKTIVVFPTART